MRTLAIAFVIAASLAGAVPAWAMAPGDGQSSKTGDKEVARALAERGFELLEQGEAEKAIVSFRMAERRIHSPVHQLFIARAEIKLGKLIDALKTYESIVAEKVPQGSPRPFQDAQDDAKKELEALRERVPSLKVVVQGVAPAEAQVSIDGVRVEPSSLGASQLIDPGKHTITASAPGVAPVEKTITMAEGSYVQTVELMLEPSGVSIPAVLAFSLGGVGLVVGTATGVAYLGKTNSNPTFGAISLAGFITGGVGIVTGTLVLALGSSDTPSPAAPETKTATRPQIHAKIGPGSLIIGGTF